MRGVIFKDGISKFRVSLKIYPEPVVERVFGKGRRVGAYYLYEVGLPPEEVYEKFGKVLEMVIDG